MSTTSFTMFLFVIATATYCSASPLSRSNNRRHLAKPSPSETSSMLDTLSELITVLQPHQVEERRFLRQIERQFLRELNTRRHKKRNSHAPSETLIDTSRQARVLLQFARRAKTNPKLDCELDTFLNKRKDISHCSHLPTN